MFYLRRSTSDRTQTYHRWLRCQATPLPEPEAWGSWSEARSFDNAVTALLFMHAAAENAALHERTAAVWAVVIATEAFQGKPGFGRLTPRVLAVLPYARGYAAGLGLLHLLPQAGTGRATPTGPVGP